MDSPIDYRSPRGTDQSAGGASALVWTAKGSGFLAAVVALIWLSIMSGWSSGWGLASVLIGITGAVLTFVWSVFLRSAQDRRIKWIGLGLLLMWFRLITEVGWIAATASSSSRMFADDLLTPRSQIFGSTVLVVLTSVTTVLLALVYWIGIGADRDGGRVIE